MSLTDNGNMIMPVAPTGSFGGGSGWGDGIWLILLLLFAGWGNGFGGGFGGGGFDGMYPWLTQNTNQGFDQAATAASLAGIQSSITNGFGNAEVAACNRAMTDLQASYTNQIAAMNQSFANQQALAAQLNGMQAAQASCCCENRLGLANLQSVIQSEACADRAAVTDALRDVIASNTANTQGVLNAINGGIQGIKDQLCSDKIDAKNEKIAELQAQLSMAQLAASQNAQTAAIIANNEAQTTALEQYLAPTPRPAYVVPSPYCCNQNYGYGCGA